MAQHNFPGIFKLSTHIQIAYYSMANIPFFHNFHQNEKENQLR